jgi:hypothetical protein
MLLSVGVPSRKVGASTVVVDKGDRTIEASVFSKGLISTKMMYTL